jgi:hypothetical protein
MDYICMNGSYIPAGTAETIAAYDYNHDGIADLWDVYSHGLANFYILFPPFTAPHNASPTDYNAFITFIPPGGYGRIFILGDVDLLADEDLYFSLYRTIQKIDPQDTWSEGFFSTLSYSAKCLINQMDIINGVATRTTPDMFRIRNLYSWEFLYHDKAGTTRGCPLPDAPLTGPMDVVIP